MSHKLSINRNELVELVLFITFIAITLTLNILKLDGLMTLIGFFFIIAISVVCILNYKNYSVKTKKLETNSLLFFWSVFAKIMVLIAFIFTKANYPGKDVLFLVASMLSLVYIIICLNKKSWKETFVMLIYRESLTVFCFLNLIGHNFGE